MVKGECGIQTWETRRILPRALSPRPMPTLTKPQILRAVADLPDDATVEDAIERLLFLSQIEAGLADVREGRTFTHEDVVAEIERRITDRAHPGG